EGDELTYTVTDGPAHGKVEIDPKTGDYTYTPDPDYNGDDSFTITVTDKDGKTVVVEVPVTVNPVNDAPEFDEGQDGTDPTAPLTVAEDPTQPLTGTVTADDVDLPEGDEITFSTGGKSANGGIVEVDPITGEYKYTPAKDFNGKDSFTITVTDKAGLTDTITINVDVTPVDDPLEANKNQPLITDSGKPVTGFIDVNDVDGDDLSFKLKGFDDSTIAENGLQTVILKDGKGADIGKLVLDTNTGVYTFTPDANYKGRSEE